MFGIQYNHWKLTCEAYQKAHTRRKESYLQLFPLSKISDDIWEKLKSQDFFDTYIATGSFVQFPYVMFHTSHYIQKDDGSFRDAELLSPLLFLILQAVGKSLSDFCSNTRPYNVSAYYAGNFDEGSYFYKSEYDKFYKELNESIDLYQYYIKTDISSFFSNIDINVLIRKLEDKVNEYEASLSPVRLNLIKELLSYCGAGSFPLVESSVTSSFLATIIYLEQIDRDLLSFVQNKIDCVDGVRLVRYVDDLYILLHCDEESSFSEIHEASIEIRNKYSSLLKEEGLSLNTKKYAFRETHEICEDLKKSLYDEHYSEEATEISDYFPNALRDFLSDILDKIQKDCIDLEQYNSMIQEHFLRDDIEFTPDEVYNYLIYGSEQIKESEVIENTIAQIAVDDISVISLDAKRLLPLLIKLQSDTAIKKVLNRLFERHRNSIWNSNDTTIAISYLLHSGFKHIDLLNVLHDEAPRLYEYYSRYCTKRPSIIIGQKYKLRSTVIGNDWIANYLYFMYLAREDYANPFEAFAFYKSFFDRITTDIAHATGVDKKSTNYENYYQERQLKKFYLEIDGSEMIIKKAHKLRNMNPINHSSSGIIEKSERMNELSVCAESLESIIDRYIALKKENISCYNKH